MSCVVNLCPTRSIAAQYALDINTKRRYVDNFDHFAANNDYDRFCSVLLAKHCHQVIGNGKSV